MTDPIVSLAVSLVEVERMCRVAKTVRLWLSFADGNLPTGHQFLGAVMVEVGRVEGADPFLAAVRKAHVLGINPGGEVRSMELPDDADIHPSWLNVLLDRATIEAADTVEGWALQRVEGKKT